MELVFLGTGAGMPSRERNVASLALSWLPEAAEFWLFDAGEATQHQLWNTGLSLHRLSRIFITHLHGDHVYGLPGILGSRSALGAHHTLTLYGPPGIQEWTETTLRCSRVHLGYPLIIEEAPESTPKTLPFVALDEGGTRVTAAWLQHGIPCLGYRVMEADTQGSLDAATLRRFGVPPGPLYGQLKRGDTITLPDGRTLNGRDLVGPPKTGRVVAIMGDTTPCDASVLLAQGADVLVHEATFDEEEQNHAGQFGHSTARQAADIAKRAHVSTLILTHISARYKQDEGQSLLHSARQVFSNTQLAMDGARHQVPRRDPD